MDEASVVEVASEEDEPDDAVVEAVVVVAAILPLGPYPDK